MTQLKSFKNLPKEDQSVYRKAIDLLISLVKLNSEIGIDGWVSAMMAWIAHETRLNGFKLEEYQCAMRRTAEAYKSLWEEPMDEEIRKIEKKAKGIEKSLKHLGS